MRTERSRSSSAASAASSVSRRALGQHERLRRGAPAARGALGLLGRPQGQARAPAGGAAAVARLVGDDRQQPRPERRAGAEARQRAPRLHEALLRGLLGVGGRAARQAGDAKGDVLVCAHEGSIGDGVAPLGPRDQRGFVVRWPAHHRYLYTLAAARRSRTGVRRRVREDGARGRAPREDRGVDRLRDVPARRPLDPARRSPRRRALGEPPQPLLARARHVARQRDPRLRHGRGRRAPRRRAPVPRLARLPGGGRLPRAARAGHAEGPARRAQRRLRPRHAGRACWWRRRSRR